MKGKSPWCPFETYHMHVHGDIMGFENSENHFFFCDGFFNVNKKRSPMLLTAVLIGKNPCLRAVINLAYNFTYKYSGIVTKCDTCKHKWHAM